MHLILIAYLKEKCGFLSEEILKKYNYPYLQSGGHELEHLKFPALNLLLTLWRHLAASSTVMILSNLKWKIRKGIME